MTPRGKRKSQRVFSLLVTLQINTVIKTDFNSQRRRRRRKMMRRSKKNGVLGWLLQNRCPI